MAVTENNYTGNGTQVLFSFSFEYIETSDIKVTLDGVVTTAYTLANATTVQFNTAPASGVKIRIYRETASEDLSATFFPGSAIRASDLNDNFTQVLHLAQETNNNAVKTDGTVEMRGDLDMDGFEIVNLATPTTANSAATKLYVDERLNSGDTAIPSYTEWRFTASGGETTVSGVGENGFTLGYSPGKEFVFLNGALLKRGTDYNAGNGTSVVFTVALTDGDLVDVRCINSIATSVADAAEDVGYGNQYGGQVDRSVASKLSEIVSVKDFGAVGDGVVDDTAAIQAGIDAVHAAGGGILYLPKGTYLVSTSAKSTLLYNFDGTSQAASSVCCLLLLPKVILKGEGRKSTIITSTSIHTLVVAYDCNYSGIQGLQLKGRSSTNNAAHGIRIFGSSSDYDCLGLTIHDCEIKDVGGYGIALNEGNLTYTSIQNVLIDNVGADGIDIKNRSSNVSESNSYNRISNVTVRNHGARLGSGETGIDIRGSWVVSDINVSLNGPNTLGLRVRPQDADNRTGQDCSVSNVVVIGGSHTDTTGVYVDGDRISLTNVVINDVTSGLVVAGNSANVTISNMVVDGFTEYGYFIGTGADQTLLTNIISVNATGSPITHFRTEGENTTLCGYHFDSSATAFSVAGIADPTLVRVGASGSTASTISFNAGTIQAKGTATDINIQLQPKGAGQVTLLSKGEISVNGGGTTYPTFRVSNTFSGTPTERVLAAYEFYSGDASAPMGASVRGSIDIYSNSNGGASDYMRFHVDGVWCFGVSSKWFFLNDSTSVPASNPTGGGFLYVEAGALKYRGSSGTVTTIAAA